MLTAKSKCLLDRDAHGECSVGDKAIVRAMNESLKMIFMRIIKILLPSFLNKLSL
jgi:hypothetical protein